MTTDHLVHYLLDHLNIEVRCFNVRAAIYSEQAILGQNAIALNGKNMKALLANGPFYWLGQMLETLASLTRTNWPRYVRELIIDSGSGSQGVKGKA